MKCPYCKIHYMDDERVCPICGRPNPRRRPVQAAVPVQKKPKPAQKTAQKPKASGAQPARTTAAPARQTAQPAGSRRQNPRRSSTRLGLIVFLFVFLFCLLPSLLGVLFSLLPL